jgi:hypothetical protein
MKMSSEETRVPDIDPTVPATGHAARPDVRRSVRAMDWIVILCLAALAGFGAWKIGESTMTYSKLPRAVAENYRDTGPLNAMMPGVNSINGALTFGSLGGLLGLAMGLAGGVTRRSLSSAAVGAVVGLILGAAAGALPSPLVMPWQWRHRNDDPFNADLLTPFLIHLALWAPLGLAAGLAFGVGSYGFNVRRLVEAGAAGLIGAVFGIFIFEVAGALLFSADGTTLPFSLTDRTRLLARLCVALCVALAAIRVIPPLVERETRTA